MISSPISQLAPTIDRLRQKRFLAKNAVQSVLLALGVAISLPSVALTTCKELNISINKGDNLRVNKVGKNELAAELFDQKNQLVWQRCAVGMVWNGQTCTGSPKKLSWTEASVFSIGADWRLPSLEELVERSCYNKTIQDTWFPNNPKGLFWTSVPHDDKPDVYWLVNFETKQKIYFDNTFMQYVRLVKNAP